MSNRGMAIAYRQTSRDAWDSLLPVTAKLDRAIMGALDAAGASGLTCQAIEAAIGREHQSVSGNLRHLVEAGLVRESGRHGKTRSGRRAVIWVASRYAAGQLSLF